jgi:RNA polymerase sigma factor (TIGR02999 family)
MHNGPMQPPVALTDLIQRANAGDEGALQRVFDATYADLRKLARIRMSSGGPGGLLDSTALVHESYLRFANAGEINITDRKHFLRHAGRVMRSVIVDFVRERRGGRNAHPACESGASGEDEILRVHEALEELARYDQRLVRVVEMRYFAGMTETEIADALGITDRTARRDWEKARLLLAQMLAK